ncbi:hypothetical protein GGH99_005070 [Coemansia sp. RSA 1285]|nr:hypothetical protein GGH99_005070 [Coemansia sp. RSA 1285]
MSSPTHTGGESSKNPKRKATEEVEPTSPVGMGGLSSYQYSSSSWPSKMAKKAKQADVDEAGQEDEALGIEFQLAPGLIKRAPPESSLLFKTTNVRSSENAGASRIEMKIAADQELKEIVTHHTERAVSDILKPVLPENEIERGALEGAMAYVADRFAEMAKTAPQAKAASKFKKYKAVRMLIGSHKGKSVGAPRASTSTTASTSKYNLRPRTRSMLRKTTTLGRDNSPENDSDDGLETISSPSSFPSEKNMYPAISALFEFVADSVAGYWDGHGDNLGKPRRISAAKKFDFKPRDSLDLTRIDIAISGSSKSPKQLSFADMLLVVEAKRKADSYNEALAQLIHYTRLLYAKQYNRRFVWGMTVCATVVRLYVFGHDRIYESPSIDLWVPEQCADLVRLFVSWAFCPVSILGFDKTIEYLPEYNCLRIQAESLDGGKPHFFYAQNMHRAPENVFGRHTTCFLASEKPPRICLPSGTSDTQSTKARDAEATNEGKKIKDWIEGVQTVVNIEKTGTASILEAARASVTKAVTKIAKARFPVTDKSSDSAAVKACVSKIVEAIVDFAVNPGEDYSAERVSSLAAEPEQVFNAAAARILAVGATIVADVIDYETADISASPLELAMGQIAAAKAELIQSIDSERFELDRFVKDAWSFSEWSQVPDRHDEVQYLSEIGSRFQDDETMQGKFPLIVAGGSVCYKTRWCSDDSAPISDDTETAFPMVNRDVLQKSKFRQHKRIVLDMVACRLNDVESVDELIAVVADAMHANHRILSECGILHRDMSPHNILFTRDQDRNPTGMLIDFDCAVHLADAVAEGPNRTGTGPYMSIANLQGLEFPRTELDDWESLIYVLSMMATFGVTTEDRHALRESIARDISKEMLQQKLPIGEWRNSSYYSAGCSKMAHMGSSEVFEGSITDHFLPIASYEPLKKLITDLRDCLFNNPRMSFFGQGAEIKPSYPEATFAMYVTGYDDAGINQDVASPFARRAACAGAIARDLCDILNRKGSGA